MIFIDASSPRSARLLRRAASAGVIFGDEARDSILAAVCSSCLIAFRVFRFCISLGREPQNALHESEIWV